ncbi:MAG: hypothetical protein H0T73_03635, partial [Ardenticatenales bacterium]|nr:hypothetical protein [Ardenticatenales bacterium]
LVDALLTLLVPNQPRNYNQAAGGERKGERNEVTYVRGAYGKVQQEDDYRAKTQYMRGENSYSVLLGYFRNEAYGQEVTLAQVFWFQNGLKKFFVVSTRELSIAEHFSHFDTSAELKGRLRRLKGKGVEVEVYDQFSRYSKHFCKLFSLRSSKALDLFNQTVTIKEIGELNDFVRNHMLERSTAPEKLRQLQDHYENLLVAYGAIKKAEEQLLLLRPLVSDARKYEQVQAQATEMEGCKAALPFYFRKRKLHLYEKALTLAQRDWDQAKSQQKQVKSALELLRQRSIALNVAIGNDESGQRSRELEQELKFARENYQRKKERAAQYDQLIHEFKLTGYLDEPTFHQSRHKAQSFRTVIEQQLSKLEKELSDLQLEEKEVGEEHNEAQRELHSLRARTSQIPSQILQLRQQILNALGIDEIDIPFVGELLKVKESERAWEGAIERLLHNFGLSLLVPERHYQRFNLHVNQTNLQARIVFHRVRDGQNYRSNPHLEGAALFHKVEIKPQSDYYEWIENELQKRFNYICCEEMSHFERVARAITKNGLTKGGHERHEKDDRRRIDDRRYYILGWDNLNKIRLIEAMVEKLSEQLRAKETEIRQSREKRDLAYKKRDKLETLLRFSDFAEIDWRTDEANIRDLHAQQTRLEQSSDHLQQLRQELKETEQKITEVAKEEDNISRDVGRLQYQVQAYEKEITQCQSYLREIDEEALRLHSPRIQEQVSSDLTLSTIEGVEGEVREFFDKEIGNARGRISQRRGRLEAAMQKYKDLYPVETNEFDADVEAIPEFDRELARIDRDDLPQYKDRFKLLLDEKIIEAIAYLQAELDDYVEDLKESIDNLNQSLRKINYTPDTYI